MLANHGQLPPHLLAPEVAASAREILAGVEIDPVGLEAIDEAKEQLKLERDAIAGGYPARLEQAAAVAQSGGASLHLAALALKVSPGASRRMSPQEQIDHATARLDEIIADLDAVKGGNADAAKRVDDLFDAIIERVLAPAGASA